MPLLEASLLKQQAECVQASPMQRLHKFGPSGQSLLGTEHTTDSTASAYGHAHEHDLMILQCLHGFMQSLNAPDMSGFEYLLASERPMVSFLEVQAIGACLIAEVA